MGEVIDARGQACPQPVLMTKKTLESREEGTFSVVVDSAISRDNVVRFATSQGCETAVKTKGNEFHIEVTKGKGGLEKNGHVSPAGSGDPSKIVVYVHSNTMGRGDDALGGILIKGFLKTLRDVDPKPAKLVFVNKGVFLTTEGSELIGDILELEEMGIEVLSCGTCLDFFNLKEKLKVGLASNMFDITSALMQADKVVMP